MPKPQTDTLQKIKYAATCLFFEKGYTATTYQAIADRSGLQRTNVQYYFPNKTALALTMLEELLVASKKELERSDLRTEDPLVNLFDIGQIFFGALLYKPESKTFTEEVFSDRYLTASIIDLDFHWGLDYLRVDLSLRDPSFTEDIIFYMGGFYEILFQSLVRGESFSVYNQLSKVMQTIFDHLGKTEEESQRILEQSRIPEETMQRFCENITRSLLEDPGSFSGE